MTKKKISIIGLGFVGLPLACILSNTPNKNLQIICIDKKFKNKKLEKKIFLNKFKKNLVDTKMISTVNKAVRNKNLSLYNDIKHIRNSETIVVSVNFDFQSINIKKAFVKNDFIYQDTSLLEFHFIIYQFNQNIKKYLSRSIFFIKN